MKFGQLILGKIIKIVATRCRVLKLKCTQIDLDFPVGEPAGIKGTYWNKGDLLE